MKIVTDKDKKIAVYGALQRLLNKASAEYPYDSKDFGFEVGQCPSCFGFDIGLVPNMMEISKDYTNFEPALGDLLLQKLIDSKTICKPTFKREQLFVKDIKFDIGELDEKY